MNWINEYGLNNISFRFFYNEEEAKIAYDNALKDWNTNKIKPKYNGKK